MCNCFRFFPQEVSPVIRLLVESNLCMCLMCPDMVVVLLAKTDQGQKWAGVTAEDAKATEARKPKMNNDDPSSGMMDLMKQMYDDGDDKMKQVGLMFCITHSTSFKIRVQHVSYVQYLLIKLITIRIQGYFSGLLLR